MTAPDNGSNAFTQAAAVTTGPGGTWSATLPPGPSRLVEAVYGGTSATEPVSSAQLQLIVPASIKLLSISPRNVAWGGTIHLSGVIRGGYLPAAGENVRLRICSDPTCSRRARSTYGVQTQVAGNGDFSTSYTFGAGDPAIHRQYWFEISTLPAGDYPYVTGTSNRITVFVGGNASRSAAPRPKHHKAKKHKKGKRR
jgi:hypothetical protein